MTALWGGRAVLAAAFALGAASAAAQGAGFLDRFDGTWTGSGMVQRNMEGSPHQVNCRMAGESSPEAVSIGGTCRAHLIFTREVSADLVRDPATGRFSGTYVGSKIGPARLSGERKGSAVDLTITWPRTVNGDRTAAMQIVNGGDGRMRIIVSDRMGADGPLRTTTDITLSKS